MTLCSSLFNQEKSDLVDNGFRERDMLRREETKTGKRRGGGMIYKTMSGSGVFCGHGRGL
jgi:hypothetical protein